MIISTSLASELLNQERLHCTISKQPLRLFDIYVLLSSLCFDNSMVFRIDHLSETYKTIDQYLGRAKGNFTQYRREVTLKVCLKHIYLLLTIQFPHCLNH
jgi:hypothetical protein